MTNREIADELKEMGLFYEMEGVPFKPAAYARAAAGVAATDTLLATIFAEGGKNALKKIDGVGEGIAAHIMALLSKGKFAEHERFRKKYPIDVLELTSIENVGAKTAKALYKALKVANLRDLERAAKSGRIRTLAGFGAKSEENILKSIELRRHASGRQVLGRILPLAERIVDELRRLPGVSKVDAAGSVRRRQETVGDLDILIATKDPEKAMAMFSGSPEVAEVIEHGATKTVVRLANGMHADLRLVPEDCYGAALQYFTGSKEHNVVIRKMAIDKGLKLNEYGLWRGKKLLASETEEAVYKALGLPYIEPEMRTDTGEFEAAKKNALPKLIAYGAVRGDLQTQTSWTDGEASIHDMAEAARALGREYIAVTDHTKSLAMTGGLDAKGLARQAKEIDGLNQAYAKKHIAFRILKGAEVNIMKDGLLDIPDEALAKLDVVGASIHSHFRLSREEQTARMIAAMQNPHVDIIFHPTGRVINERAPYEIDIAAVIAAAKKTRTVLEIDAYPDRSDLKDAHVRMAVEAGVKMAIDTDAHHPSHLAYLDLGVAIARRGWAEAKDVINTKTLEELLRWLGKEKTKRA